MEFAWAKDVDAVFTTFKTHPEKGLTDKQVQELTEKHGKNEIPPEEATPFWKLVLSQFDDQLVKILLFAALVSLGLAFLETDEDERFTAFVEPVVIGLILIANAAVGVIQERNAEEAIEALKEYEAQSAVVIRNGRVQTVEAVDLVPGDLVEVAVGTRAPADIRMVKMLSNSFRMDQAILTGESESVPKSLDVVHDVKAVNQDKTNIIFSGTYVSVGKCRGVVVNTGLQTAIGSIKQALMEMDQQSSPLKKKIDEFGDMLSKVITVICILVWVININHFADPEHGSWIRGAVYYFKIAVALAVAAIPEGLPAVLTTCLALGTVKMAENNAIVRSLPSVESLGCTTVICSDKTGTLTTNKMSVTHVVTLKTYKRSIASERFRVSGSDFSPSGDITNEAGEVLPNPFQHPSLASVARAASLCNDGSLEYSQKTESFEKVGESTEVALKVLAEKVKYADADKLDKLSNEERAHACSNYWQAQYPRLATMEFNRDRKSMSVLCQSQSGGNVLLVKGAPEAILDRSTTVQAYDAKSGTTITKNLTATAKKVILAELEELASKSLRCLALAEIPQARDISDYDFDPRNYLTYESDMTFLGIAAMLDPPREEVKDAIRTCRDAGMRVIVITGDNKATAEAICRKIGVFGENEDVKNKSFTGREFDSLSEQEQQRAVQEASLFSRTEPAHKSKLVDLLRANSEVVAMTGDGVNDAPALKKADIGIAMGSGTAVAKCAAEMVLADDNFATIVHAVQEGRAIYNNTKQFIRYLISSNIGEVACIFLTAALGLPEVLVPVQLLWVNLVTDGLPATALSKNPPDSDIMKQKPRGTDDPIVNSWLFIRYMVIGLYIGAATVFGFVYWYLYFEDGPLISYEQLTNFHVCPEAEDAMHPLYPTISCEIFEDDRPPTVALSILVIIEMLNALNAVSENQSIFSMPPWINLWLIFAVILSLVLHMVVVYVPFFSMIFGLAPLSWAEWKIVLGLSLPVLLLDEIMKFCSRVFGK